MSRHILHIAGWSSCSFYRRAASVVDSLSILFPTRLKVINHEFENRSGYRSWLINDDDSSNGGFRTKLEDERAHNHASSPFCWLSKSDSDIGKSLQPDPSDIQSFIGGHDDTLQFCRDFCSPVEDDTNNEEDAVMVEDGHVSNHEYDYDLVVIGGGSGGLACSKEAASLGAKVAVLDYVTPSPAGSVWGLGGTCVNVGCIPKKLMHHAAFINESIHLDAAPFGISSETTEHQEDRMEHNWESMRENVQNHIRGLNFKYRISLNGANVDYINKHGKFIDKHTLQLTDKKGNISTISSSRFVIAVGGRPTPLNCEGGHLAISSDDVFALQTNPGKVLCVGASYISLECAGFLAGLGHEVIVAVRSILLRGFDREIADKIGAYMEDHGVLFKREVLPTKLEKMEDSGRIRVLFSDGSEDVFDTVLVAIGRQADTANLGLQSVNIDTNDNNCKICTKYEQTSTPNIYAVGDVVEGCAELTPVAIEAGLSLAKRLFGNSKKQMDYDNVATTVFTPIEYGCVGLSEDDAINIHGKANIEVYHKSFMPLEWSISDKRQTHQAFTKVIVDKTANEKILGIHYLGPNAGEVMQGFGLAIKKGITFDDLKSTVGIHPTTAEEIVTLSITKSSGEDATAAGC